MSTQDPKSSEFTESHDAEFKGVAKWMGTTGLLAVLLGILLAASGFLPPFDTPRLITGIVGFIVGVRTLMTAVFFNDISTKENRVVDQVMNAVVNVKQLHCLQVVMIFIYALGEFFGSAVD